MADDANLDVVDALFDSEIAKDATWLQAGADPAPCRVILHRRGLLSRGAQPVTFHGGGLSVAESAIDILVRRAEIAKPGEGDTVTVTESGKIYPVGMDPVFDDPDDLVWRCASVQGEPAE